uniref:KOW domain-containing protein n=2 Tax=Lactuca sativa TaxID=4236 RepID=A0A9R1VF58_LACSA|nr:hypothetical protein LSAT_V11C500282860 [Lactuca sativa]
MGLLLGIQRSRGFTAGHAALKADACKVAKHENACIENQHVFVPFAFDTFGFLASEAMELLNRVQQVINSNVISPRFTNFCHPERASGATYCPFAFHQYGSIKRDHRRGCAAASEEERRSSTGRDYRRSPSRHYNATMARGLKKHMKRLNAPKHWMLDKLGGAFAPKPSSGPHKSRECLPLILILRNRLKYALTYREVQSILMQRHVLVDNKVRTDKTYPAGFMDVVSIPKTNENFRLLYDTKGRFRLHSVRDEESKFKLCKVRSVQFGSKGIPYINTYDGRTIRYPDPLIKANDTIKLDLDSNKIVDFIKFDVGNVVMVTGGRNTGRVGILKNREKHKGSFETVHIQDSTGHEFATRLGNVFTLGKGTKPWVSLPKGKGIKLTIIEEARKRQAAVAATA